MDINTLLNPPDQQDDFTRHLRDAEGYLAAKRLDDGSYVALLQLMFTRAICFDVDAVGYGRRYCYEDSAACIHSFIAIESRNDKPEGWIAQR